MTIPEGYEEIQLPYNIGSNRPLFDSSGGRKVHLHLYGHPTEKKVRGPLIFDEQFMGPPGYVHGGAQAYVLDEVMGTAGWHAGLPVIAQTIAMEFFHMVPIGPELTLEGEVVRVHERKIEITGSLFHGDKRLAASTGVFHRMEYARFKHLIDAADIDMSRWFGGNK